jgi:H+/Cl- antiporter ClcA
VLALLVAGLATLAAHALHLAISAITRLAFYGKWSHEAVSPTGHGLGAWVILVPALGGGLIALLARFGSRGVVGHGIPEVMQQVLANRSRISPRVAVLKPLASAISIGTGAPYGAEGPVIALGGATGSLLGQALTMTTNERKILLAAGAAAAMTAIFGSPVAATLLAVELLLFEFRARSAVPVALAAALAQALRMAAGEGGAVFPLAASAAEDIAPLTALGCFAGIGAVAGVLAVAAGGAVHRTEDFFARLPINPLWCPVLGGLVVGVAGWCEPRVLGAGYEVITSLLGGELGAGTVALVCGLKLVIWIVSLGSGTSGGTLAPMLVVGGGVGALAATAAQGAGLAGVSPGLAALAGMTAFFAGGSRALFASVVLAVEITHQAGALWPAATAAAVAVGVAHLLSPRSLMTEAVERRGVRVPADFAADVFEQVRVGEVMEKNPVVIDEAMRVGELADRIGAGDAGLSRSQAYLVKNADGRLAGIITRGDLLAAVERGDAGETLDAVMTRDPVRAFPDETLHEALERMHAHDVGRLPVVERAAPHALVGYLGRAAILSARQMRWREHHEPEPGWWKKRGR